MLQTRDTHERPHQSHKRETTTNVDMPAMERIGTYLPAGQQEFLVQSRHIVKLLDYALIAAALVLVFCRL
jgi:hypothetical protein